MQGIKVSGTERGSLLEWRWTPFFALLTLALVVSLLTALVVPATPAQLFGTAEATRGLGPRSGIPTQSGLSGAVAADELSGSDSDSNGSVSASGGTRRGSLQRLSDRNRALSARPAPAPRRTAEPIRREIPPPPEPEVSNDHNEPEQVQDQAEDEPEEDEPEAPQSAGAGGAGADQDSEQDEEGPPAPLERPKLLNPGVLRTIPGLQR
ncbi:MAG: hypothetical protein H6718_05770 [Polyangiaceae bacterium]|nr:hypothetical protein [Myxococcales bacterium]MCB9584883.1 hypothetical protein [Polyangiaceae bacterium]MCB9607544.1 hypothetical protein [Polyangiaceae bacterium]